MERSALASYRSRRRFLQWAIVSVTLLLLSTVGFAAFTWATRGNEESSTNGKGNPFHTASLESAQTDRITPTVQEIFPTDTFISRGRTYEILRTNRPEKCGEAAQGQELVQELEKRKCRGVVRATARQKDGPMVVTLGLADLQDGDGVQAVENLLDDPRINRFPIMEVDQARDLENSNKLVLQRATGHYLLFFAVALPGGSLSSGDPEASQVLEDCDIYLNSALAAHALSGGQR